jgi:hypothetical protein
MKKRKAGKWRWPMRGILCFFLLWWGYLYLQYMYVREGEYGAVDSAVDETAPLTAPPQLPPALQSLAIAPAVVAAAPAALAAPMDDVHRELVAPAAPASPVAPAAPATVIAAKRELLQQEKERAAAAAAAAPTTVKAVAVQPAAAAGAMPTSYNSFAKFNDAVVETSVVMDSAAFTISAWIKLDPKDKDTSIKTIFSNKEPGCAPGKGIALCVNTWQTNDLLLYFEYADSEKGCKSVTSGKHRVTYGEWLHVAVSAQAASADNTGAASLYINGKPVGKLPPHEQPKFSGPFAAASSTLVIGGFGNLMHRFKGEMGAIAVWTKVFNEAELQAQYNAEKMIVGRISSPAFTSYISAAAINAGKKTSGNWLTNVMGQKLNVDKGGAFVPAWKGAAVGLGLLPSRLATVPPPTELKSFFVLQRPLGKYPSSGMVDLTGHISPSLVKWLKDGNSFGGAATTAAAGIDSGQAQLDKPLDLAPPGGAGGRVEAALVALDASSPQTTHTLPKAAVVVLAHNRPGELSKVLHGLLSQPEADRRVFDLCISLDVNNGAIQALAKRHSLTVWQHPPLPPPRNPFEQGGYHKIARHFFNALSEGFDKRGYSHMILLEDDLLPSPDFLSYFRQVIVPIPHPLNALLHSYTPMLPECSFTLLCCPNALLHSYAARTTGGVRS